MLQKHNRHMSFSIYVCVLAVADTVSLTSGKLVIFVKRNTIVLSTRSFGSVVQNI